MTKTKKAAMSGEDKKSMDAVLRRMLSTPPRPAVHPPVAAKSPKKRSAGKKKPKQC